MFPVFQIVACWPRRAITCRAAGKRRAIAKAKREGAYRGRPEDTARNAGIASMLRDGS